MRRILLALVAAAAAFVAAPASAQFFISEQSGAFTLDGVNGVSVYTFADALGPANGGGLALNGNVTINGAVGSRFINVNAPVSIGYYHPPEGGQYTFNANYRIAPRFQAGGKPPPAAFVRYLTAPFSWQDSATGLWNRNAVAEIFIFARSAAAPMGAIKIQIYDKGTGVTLDGTFGADGKVAPVPLYLGYTTLYIYPS